MNFGRRRSPKHFRGGEEQPRANSCAYEVRAKQDGEEESLQRPDLTGSAIHATEDTAPRSPVRCAPRRAPRRGAILCAAIAMGLLLAAAAAYADRVIVGDVEASAYGRLEPFRLPRDGTAPISVYIAGHISTTDGTAPPQLQRMTILLNRHGVLQSKGMPVCHINQIQPTSSEAALAACGRSLIGEGQFWAEIVLPGQAPYPTEGRLLAFNGFEGNRHVVFVHIFTDNPFFNSFVITFTLRHISHGRYGTELQASLPQALGSWGYVNRIKMTLSRKYPYQGKELSYFNAACPAPKGFSSTTFQLAKANFFFADGKELGVTLTRPCAVK